MNELRPHLNERDPEDGIVKKGLKEFKSLPIPTRCIFPFSDLIELHG